MEGAVLEIVDYRPEHQPWFEKLNRDWIERYFRMEPIDFEVLQHPDEQILKTGGSIFMATMGRQPAGTVALKKAEAGVYELTKMAVDERFQGRRIGSALAESAIGWARKSGAKRIVLYSSTKLQPALSLYKKLGFREVPVDGPYVRSDIKMELDLSLPARRLMWFERQFTFGLSPLMLPFYLERLEGTVARIREKVKGKPEEMLSRKVNNKWSVKQNIGHLAEVDEIANRRIGEMRAGISPLSPAVFETRMDYNSQPLQNVIDYFALGRFANIALYRSLAAEELSQSSLHPRLKLRMTPVDLAWFDAEHDDHHLVTIGELLKSLSNEYH